MSNNVTFIKTNILMLMFLPGYYQVLKLLAKSRTFVSNYYSKINFEFHNWLQSLLYFTFFNCVISALVIFIHMYIEQIPYSFEFILWVIIITNVYLYYICYVKYLPQFKFCVVRDRVLTKEADNRKQEKELQQLIQYDLQVDKDTLFLDPNLTLPKLAAHLGIHAKSFSTLINKHYKMSFHEYINRKRIEVSKSKLLDSAYAQYTITAIGMESGFSSRSTFYSTFKKFVGCTPNQFKQTATTDYGFGQQLSPQ